MTRSRYRRSHGRGLRRGNGRRRGQVLVIMVVMAIILLVMALFLFDLQGMIRTRAKTQTGSDAAALAGANWQGKSLNMIGELNLIKASTLLNAGVVTDPSDPTNPTLMSMDMISEMQARISYVGPLMGYAAAQQAAKANQMRSNPAYTYQLADHVENVRILYPGLFADDAAGYAWIDPYADMLQAIADQGVAAKPVNSEYLLQPPDLRGALGYLVSDPDFYAAVHGNWYCWFLYNRSIDPNGDYGFDDISVHRDTHYALGSEFLPLKIDIPAILSEPDYTVLQPYLDDRGLFPHQPDDEGNLPLIQWATYGYEWDDTSMYEAFNEYGYFRSDFKSEYMGNGAAACFTVNSEPSLITGRWTWEYGEDPNQSTNTNLGDRSALGFSNKKIDGASFADHGQRMNRAEAEVERLRGSDGVKSIAAAKPFGSLGNDRASAAGIVLPVFTDVRLLPVSLVPQTAADMDPDFYIFLLDYFGNDSYPNVPPDVAARWSYYISALDAFADPNSAFRQGLADYQTWRMETIAGPDGVVGTDDDVWDPCKPLPAPPRVAPIGGGGGRGTHSSGSGSSRGGPPFGH